MLKVGIIGCGRITEVRHAPEYTANPNAELVGFYDFFPEKAEAMAAQYHCKAFASVEEMLAEVDAISVCSANNAHAEASISAMRAGKHVLCEKPMGVSLAECEEMLAVSKETGKLLMIGHNQAYTLAHRKAYELLNAGVIGKVFSFRTTFAHAGPESWTGTANPWFFDRKRAAHGALADLGIHKVDIIHFLLGEPIIKVSCLCATLDKKFPDGEPITVEDNAMAVLETKSGIIGTMHASWTLYNGKEDNSTILYGTQGVMRIYDDPEYALVVEHRDGTCDRYDLEKIATNDQQKEGKNPSSHIIDAFVDAALNGTEYHSRAEKAILGMRVMFAAAQSAEEGRCIVIDQ